ncbi:MAG: hypothetical protein VB071_10920 [Lawsonibacter sp.]|nr:hypothetical protein [Lawsonibacter sp.]
MLNQKGFATGILAVIFTVYSVLIFLLFGGALPSFWLGYVCSILLTGLCLAIVWMGFSERKSSFLGLPLAVVASLFLIIQLLGSFVVSILPIQAGLAVEAILIGLMLVCSLGALMGRQVVEVREQEVQEKVFYLQSVASELESLPPLASDAAMRKQLVSLWELVRYSDPMSHSSLAPIERRIEEQTAVLAQQVRSGDWESVTSLCGTLTHLVEERSRKCKLLK